MSSGDSFFESKKFKTIMKYVYGYGGAIVIIGAMFKIQHWPGATIMLIKAKIEPELIESLGAGMKNLSDNAGKLGDISSASEATNEYVDNLKGASSKVGELSHAYDQAATSIKEITSVSSGNSNFGDQLDKVSGNLTQLNNLYEMQLEGVSALSKASDEMSSGITNIVTNLQSSVDDTKKYKETMSDLTSNLAALNSVYGNMLSAMNVNK